MFNQLIAYVENVRVLKQKRETTGICPLNGVSDPKTLNVLRYINLSLCLTNNKQFYEKEIVLFR